MIPMIAGALAAIMMLVAALKGLRPRAPWKERLYSGLAAGWALFGVAIYHPAYLGRWAPHGLVTNPVMVTVFGFGLLALGVYGATMLIGGDHAGGA